LSEELHRLRFEADDGSRSPRSQQNRARTARTARTARAIAENLDRGDAVIKMLRSIVSIKRADHGNLISTTCTNADDALALQPQDRVPRYGPVAELVDVLSILL